MVKSETRRDAEILVRNPSPRLFGEKFRDSKKVKTNHEKTRLRDLSKTFPRFRDRAKIFRDPRFSRYHSPPLIIFCVSGSSCTHLIERKMQPLQNLCPQVVCTGSRSPKRQIGHSYLLSKGGSKYSSYPSDLGSSYDEKSLLTNELTVLGSNDASRKSDDCSSRRKERVILGPHFSLF